MKRCDEEKLLAYIVSNPGCKVKQIMLILFKDNKDYYRPLDYTLQRLRKKNRIYYDNGWHKQRNKKVKRMGKIKEKATYVEKAYTYYDAEALIPIVKEAIEEKKIELSEIKSKIDRLERILERSEECMEDLEQR